MDNPETDEKGPNERTLMAVCRMAAATAEARRRPYGVVAAVKREKPGESWTLTTLPKPTWEEACARVLEMMLFPEVAEFAKLPRASSTEELLLKLEIASPS